MISNSVLVVEHDKDMIEVPIMLLISVRKQENMAEKLSGRAKKIIKNTLTKL
jgi:hypothetical protein